MMMVPSSVFNAKTLGDILGSSLQDNRLTSMAVNKLTLDSRCVDKGDVFVALKGDLYDGKQFIMQALESGASAVLVDASEVNEIKDKEALPLVPIVQLNEHLSCFAANFYNQPSGKLSVVGITGTNGKTSCAQFFAQAVALLNGQCGVVGTTGVGVFKTLPEKETIEKSLSMTGLTTPDPINVQKILAQFADQKVQHCAMEVSSHGLVQHRVAAVDIDTAVFTNLSHDHLDYHHTMAAYGEAKAQLFAMPSVKNVVINTDDAYASTLLAGLEEHINVITYGIDEKKPHLTSTIHFSIKAVEFTGQQSTQVSLVVEQLGQRKDYLFQTKLVGQFNLSNLLAVIGALYAQGFELEEVVKVIKNIKTIDGRMEVIDSTSSVQVVVDFAHTPDALENALRALKPSLKGALWCVFGCGGDRDKTKRPEMASVAESLADYCVVTSDNPRSEDPELIIDEIVQGFERKQFYRYVDRAEAIEFAVLQANENDTILIAGKGHEDYQIIGDKKCHFSDQEQARVALHKRGGEASND